MPKISLLPLFVLSAALAFGQLDSNSITVTASRSSTLQPDQVVLGVNVSTGLSASLDDVIAALAGTGITSANFTGINNSGPFLAGLPGPGMALQPTINWAFTFPVPLAQLKAATAMLTTLQQNIGKKNTGYTLSFSVQGTQVSAQLQQSQGCSITDLVSDAKTQAQKIATAAGFNVGGILAMSSVTTSSTATSVVPSYVLLPVCSLTVKFALIRLT